MDSQALLRSIASIASGLRDMTASCSPRRRPTQHSLNLPDVQFPFPQDIKLDLEELGLRADILLQPSSPLIQLQNMYREKFRTSCLSLWTTTGPTLPVEKLWAAFRVLYEREALPIIREQISAVKARYLHRGCPNSDARPGSKKKKQMFNNEYTPLLEAYFEYNAYPSAPDRQVLARKSLMTPRQIEVWFQNHRSRARKEGKTLSRLNVNPLPLQLSLESLKQKMPFFAVSEDITTSHCKQESSDGDSSDNDGERQESVEPHCVNFFNVPAPPHAFPTIYPPICHYDPFPMSNGSHVFPAPAWPRKPAIPRQRAQPVDMDEFVVEFATKLHLREGPSHQVYGRKRSTTLDTHGKTRRHWYAATITVASRAPHPSLVKPSPLTSSVSQTPFLSLPEHVFSPGTPRNTSLPMLSGVTHTRKLAGLPRRSPKSACIGQNLAPSRSLMTSSPSSPTPSLSSSSPTCSSRSSSLSSLFSSDGCSPPLSRSSSATLTTPPTSPAHFFTSSDLPTISHEHPLFVEVSSGYHPMTHSANPQLPCSPDITLAMHGVATKLLANTSWSCVEV